MVNFYTCTKNKKEALKISWKSLFSIYLQEATIKGCICFQITVSFTSQKAAFRISFENVIVDDSYDSFALKIEYIHSKELKRKY